MRNTVQKKLKGREFLGHPAGLYVLFFTEMWERFSYYGMRSLLILYMTDYLLTDPERAATVFGYKTIESGLVSVFGAMTVQQMGSQLYGLYTGFVYFTPFFGGLLADRYLGKYRSVFLGGALMSLGHFLMASETAFCQLSSLSFLDTAFLNPTCLLKWAHCTKKGTVAWMGRLPFTTWASIWGRFSLP